VRFPGISPNVCYARRSAAEGLQQRYTKYFEVMAQNVSRFFCIRKNLDRGGSEASDEAMHSWVVR
jgi:hypothetical protein